MKIVFFPYLGNLLLKCYGDRFIKNKADCGETVCRFKRQLHVALVIVIYDCVALVVLFQEIQQCDGGVDFPVLDEMFDKDRQLQELMQLSLCQYKQHQEKYGGGFPHAVKIVREASTCRIF